MASRVDNCPECNMSFIGDPIPKEYTDKGYYGSDPKNWFWRKEQGIEVRGVYDGVLIWACPSCGHMWPRFKPENANDRLYNEAVAWIERNQNAES